MARRGKAKPGRARGLFAPPSKQVLDRTDSKLGKRRRTADYDFGDVIMPPMPGAKALAQLPVSLLLPVLSRAGCLWALGEGLRLLTLPSAILMHPYYACLYNQRCLHDGLVSLHVHL